MAPPRMLARRRFQVALDYGQFYLHAADPDEDSSTELLDVALTHRVAQRAGLVVVMSPHQNNFEMVLDVEKWTAAPPDDLDEWQEAFEFHLSVSDYGLHYYSPTLDSVDLDVPPGSYRALVTGRGFVGYGWPGSTTPGDVWRIRLYPDPGPVAAQQLRAYVEPRIVTPPTQFRDAGVAAVRRLQSTLQNVRSLSGLRGTARAERTIPGTRRSVFHSFESLSGWLTQGSSSDGMGTSWLSGGAPTNSPFDDANRIVPVGGHVRCTIIDARSPGYVKMEWSWEGPGHIGKTTPLVPSDPQMTLAFEITKGPAEREWPTVVVNVAHDLVPLESVADLSAYWAWKLEEADYNFDLSGRRMRQARES